MKKFSLILAFMLCVSVTTFASNAKCLLHHNGNVTLYDADDLNAALTASANGDTIYLSDGNFSGFTITKKITVRGSGQMTRIGGDIIVDIPDAPTLTSALLEGFRINGKIVIKSALNGLLIKQCMFKSIYAVADVNNALLDKVFIIDDLWLSEFWQDLTCVNSKIRCIDDYSSTSAGLNYSSFIKPTASIVINNCNITGIYSGGYQDYITVTNSIIRFSSGKLYESNLINCLFSSNLSYDPGTSVSEACYKDDTGGSLVDDNSLECKYDAAALKTNGYLGQDGTIVGCYGGTNPFTLELKGPKVTESSIQIDNDTKQLSVTLKVTAN